MKKVPLLIAMFLAFAVVAFAQTDTQGSSSSSQSSSPSATQSSPSSSQGSTSTGSSSTMGSQGSSSSQGSTAGQGGYSQGSTAGSQGSMSQGSTTKGAKEHKVKGCIRSEGGKYVLEDAHGKTFALNSTEDLSAHVGHEVVVHGTEGVAAGSSASSTGASASAEKEITVSKLDMVSDTCKMGGGKHGKSGASGEKGSSTTPPPSQK
ncbi:MAG TPA: DUF5818 domain-containing protein [Terriglobales bacterium]|nr:DUF5818 domain-containing protein [Terriglobales bacterium]